VSRELRGGLIGCGYFARNHLHAWREVDGARIAAVCDLNRARAEVTGAEFGINAVYDDVGTMLRAEPLDFVDIVTQPATHRELVELAARHRVHVICQKPIATALDDARAMVEACEMARVEFMIHENFRWQTPLREVKSAAAAIGELFFGQISFRSAWDVYANQPYLAEDPRFIVFDLGVHLLDLARFYLGEVKQLFCLTQRVKPRIRAEDVATILMQMESGATTIVDLSYASRLDDETFPQTLVHLDGSVGSVTLDRDYQLTIVNGEGVQRRHVPPRMYPWSEKPGINIQESVVSIQQHWVECLRTGERPETNGRDNLLTIDLVFGSYQSAESGQPYLIGAKVN
jgi:D-apiose dehydrogenase